MEKFPIPLACLTLSHIIDDKNAVEGYLREDPSAANCMPIVVRDLFFTDERNKGWKIPINNSIPDADTTRRYLTALWSGDDAYERIVEAARLGALYLIPYLFPQTLARDPEVRNYKGGFHRINDIVMENWKFQLLRKTLTNGLFAAAENGYTDVIKLLRRLGANTYLTSHRGGSEKFEYAISGAAKNNHTDTVLYLLSSDSGMMNIYEIVEAVVANNNFDLFKEIYRRYPSLMTNIYDQYPTNAAIGKTMVKWVRLIES